MKKKLYIYIFSNPLSFVESGRTFFFFFSFVTVTEETNPFQNIYAGKGLERQINKNQTSKTGQYLINLDYVGNLFRLNS